jgi:hypothetical protein
MQASAPAHVSSLDVSSLSAHPVRAVSWRAILAGAAVAASISLILVALGAGLGLSVSSPWSASTPSAGRITAYAVMWLILMQWISSGFGGFIAGRLRNRWLGTHDHEVFFRDTAHGLITWAVTTLLVATVLTSSIGNLAGSAVHAAGSIGASAAQTVAQRASSDGPVNGYGLDSLFRSTHPGTDSAGDSRAEASRILLNGLTNGNLPDADRSYLADLIAARTGISHADAQKRVDDLAAQAKTAADQAMAAADAARKNAAESSLFLALSMLLGAFIACLAAAMGGRHRDRHP